MIDTTRGDSFKRKTQYTRKKRDTAEDTARGIFIIIKEMYFNNVIFLPHAIFSLNILFNLNIF